MVKIFITGSADGLGLLSAESLLQKGHEVVLHARNETRKKDVFRKLPGASDVLVADLSDIAETKRLAEEVNSLGSFDAIIHNAGVYTAPKDILPVNVLAPYILTAVIKKPKRLIYLSSDMHLSGHANRNFSDADLFELSYSDSKLFVVMLAVFVARNWMDVLANSVNPGWVPTRMGGDAAPDDLQKGFATQVWLAQGVDPATQVSGHYLFHQLQHQHNWEADNQSRQQQLMEYCQWKTGVVFPV